MLRLLVCGMLACASGGCIAIGAPPPRVIAEVRDARLTEASGIIASRRHPGMFYVHNDSGDSPRVFLINSNGAVRAEIRLRGAQHRDYEDITLAPSLTDPNHFDVIVGDIGDNHARRADLMLYRFPEIDLAAVQAGRITVDVASMRVAYQDGPVDAEALVVHPDTGHVYVLTKPRGGGFFDVLVWRGPWRDGEQAEFTPLQRVALPGLLPLGRMATAADISPDARRLAVRTYLGGWEYALNPASPAHTVNAQPPPRVSHTETTAHIFDTIFNQPPRKLALAAEAQGESLCYDVTGQTLLTISEGAPTTLYAHDRSTPARPATREPNPAPAPHHDKTPAEPTTQPSE